MTSQSDTSNSSDRTLEEAQKRFEELSQEEERSGKYLRETPSLTLSEARKLGIGTEPTLVISTGLHKNRRE